MNYLQEALRLISSTEKLNANVDNIHETAIRIEQDIKGLLHRVAKIEQWQAMFEKSMKSECKVMIHEEVTEIYRKRLAEVSVLRTRLEEHLKDNHPSSG